MNTNDKTRLTPDELKRLRDMDFSAKDGFVDMETYLSKTVGPKNSESRSEFDAKSMAWYYGEVLKERRKTLKITQKELASRIGRERTYINRIEKGETDMQLSSFLRLTHALDLTIHLDTIH